jgi:hypothetical protein
LEAEGKFQQTSGASRREIAASHLNVIASQRVGAKRRPMTGSAKQSISPCKGRMDCFVARAPRNDGGMGESEVLRGEIHSNDGFDTLWIIRKSPGLTFAFTIAISTPPGTASGLLAF